MRINVCKYKRNVQESGYDDPIHHSPLILDLGQICKFKVFVTGRFYGSLYCSIFKFAGPRSAVSRAPDS